MTLRTDVLISTSIYGAGVISAAWLVSTTSYLWLLAFPAAALFHLFLVDMLRTDDIDPVDTWRGYLLDHGMALGFIAGPWFVLLLLAGVLW